MDEMRELTFEDMVAGYEFPSVQYEITREQVIKYVEAIGESNPLYIDEEYARRSKYGQLIAPPTIAAIVTTLGVALRGIRIPPGATHAKQYFKFIKPIMPGDKLNIKTKLADKYIQREKKYVVIESVVRNEVGEDVVLARITGIWPK